MSYRIKNTFSNNEKKLRAIITNKIRKIENVQSTLTMMVIEEQE